MLERETKREKILEARQRELRLKDRSHSEQNQEEEAGLEEGNQGPDQLIAKAESNFYCLVEEELKNRKNQEDLNHLVRLPHTCPLTLTASYVKQLTEPLFIF